MKECLGTKEFGEKSIICKKCKFYDECKKVRHRRPRLK